MDLTVKEKLLSMDGVHADEEGKLSLLTGFRTGGSALVLSPRDRDTFIEVLNILRGSGTDHFVLGNGTNVLAMDEGYGGVVLLTKEALSGISCEGTSVRAGAGVSLADVCKAACAAGLTGLEFAYGIPGSVGGAVYMNAGAYGGEMCDVLTEVEYLDGDGNVVTAPAEDLGLSYRSSIFHSDRGLTVLSATFGLERGDREEISRVMRETMQKRIDKQPLEYPSCGSTFKRPQGDYASRLIDVSGLRGFTVGGAQVSEKHCGFVINRGGATTADILSLIEEVKSRVKEKTGYDLECEIEFLK